MSFSDKFPTPYGVKFEGGSFVAEFPETAREAGIQNKMLDAWLACAKEKQEEIGELANFLYMTPYLGRMGSIAVVDLCDLLFNAALDAFLAGASSTAEIDDSVVEAANDYAKAIKKSSSRGGLTMP